MTEQLELHSEPKPLGEFTSEQELFEALHNPETFEEAWTIIHKEIRGNARKNGLKIFPDEEDIKKLVELPLGEMFRQLDKEETDEKSAHQKQNNPLRKLVKLFEFRK